MGPHLSGCRKGSCGSGFPASSILFKPGINPELRARVLAEVPLDVIPRRVDTVASLYESSVYHHRRFWRTDTCAAERDIVFATATALEVGAGRGAAREPPQPMPQPRSAVSGDGGELRDP